MRLARPMEFESASAGQLQVAPMEATAKHPSAESAAPRWRVHPLSRALGSHLAVWDDLNARRLDNHPMLSGLFVDSLLRHFGDGSEHLCVLEVGGSAEAMCVLSPRSRWIWTTFRPPQAQLGCLLIFDESALVGLIEALPGRAAALDLMCIDPRLCGHLAGAAPSFRQHHVRTMAVVVQGGYAEYLASRSSSLRKNLRRFAGAIEADALSPRYETIEDPAGVEAAVLRYANLESRGWKGAGGTALQPGNAQTRFYTDLLVAASQRGQASVHEMWLGSTLAASRLVLRSERMTVILKTTYDESLSRYAPGRLLLAEVLRAMHERGSGHAVEFYTDASADQLSWATDSRCIYDLRLYRSGPAGAAAHAAYCMRQLRRHPAPASPRPDSQVDCLTQLAELPPDVVRFFDSLVPAHGLQAGAEWFALMQRHCFAKGDSAIFVLRRKGVPVAALPLRRDGARAEALANFYTAVFEPPIAPWLKAPDLLPLIGAVRAHWPQVASVELGPMNQASQPYMLLHQALAQEGFVIFQAPRLVNWTWPRAPEVGWSQYLAARQGLVRSTVARATQRFEKRGGRIEIISSNERLEAGISAYETVYAASWKRSERYPAFVRDLMRMAARRGSLRLGVAWLGAEPIAAQLWLVVGARAEIFKLAYDERYKSLSPGTVLTAHLMRRAIEEDNVRMVDYLSGDDRYKTDWMTQRGLRWSLLAHDPRRLYGCLALLRALASAGLRALGLRRWSIQYLGRSPGTTL